MGEPWRKLLESGCGTARAIRYEMHSKKEALTAW